MYFHDRLQAGQQLARVLPRQYYEEQTAVLALSAGGVVVASEVARALGASLSLLMTAPIALPGLDNAAIVGLIDQDSHFTYNSMLPTGVLLEMIEEMHNYIEGEKLNQMRQMTRSLSKTGFVDTELFRERHVIIIDEGFKSGLPFEAAVNYLKATNTNRLVAAAPNASLTAVDSLHVLADEVHVLDVLENYLDTDHYFEDNNLPDIQSLLGTLQEHEG